MKTPFWRAVLAACCGLVTLVHAGSAAAASDARIIDEQRLPDRVVELTIATSAFAEPTKVDVDLPVGYDQHPKRHWPVTYFTAGTQNNYDSFNKILRGPKLLEPYPVILVSPDGNSGYWSDWFNGGAFGPPLYETYVIKQLIPLIDKHFRTIADRSHRAVFGVSMGGYGSMMFAARHPELFVAAATLSGAVDSNLPANGAVLSASSTFDGGPVDAIYGPRATQEVRWRGHNPTDLAGNLAGLDLQVRSANGVPNPGIGENPASADGVSCVVEGGVYMASVNFHNQLDALGIPHLWDDYGPGCHTPPNFKREVSDTLDTFVRVLADPPPPPKTFDYESIEPRFEVWGWTVSADPNRALEFLQMSDVGRRSATFTGSGTAVVRTPPIFRDRSVVEVTVQGAERSLKANRAGRLRFTVDLGPAHPDQQYTDASRAAGDGEPGYFRTTTVKFKRRG
jgi:S-formylglutathione hydrolase FrmB